LKYYYLTLRFFRWSSPGDEGVLGGVDEEEYDPLPALINGSWERRKESTVGDVAVIFNDFVDDG
jgi:hypothetical protein